MPARDIYQYTESGLDNVYLLNGFERIPTPRGELVRIQNEKGLLEAIGRWLVSEKKWLNGNEVRFLRKELGLTQNDLASILGMDVQAFARWEKGRRSRDGCAADRLLRIIYMEHVKGNPQVKEYLQQLADLDELIEEGANGGVPLVFARQSKSDCSWVREAESMYA